MQIVSTIGWRVPWLRRLIGYCCRELEYPASRIGKATFRRAGRVTFRGWADLDRREIRIKINPANSYPVSSGAERDLPAIPLVDAVEVLVLVTAHEIAHLERWERFARAARLQGKRDTFLERDTESLARKVLASFQAHRGRLLAEWGDAGPGPIPPKYLYRTECPTCGSWSLHNRPSRKMYCTTCQGEYVKHWKPGMPDPPFLECRRIPFQGAPI